MLKLLWHPRQLRHVTGAADRTQETHALDPDYKEEVVRVSEGRTRLDDGRVIVLTLPFILVSLGFALDGLAKLLKALH